MESASFFLFSAAALWLALTPGPGIFDVAARTLAGGRAEGVASSLGTGLGTLYLVWLGLRTWRSSSDALFLPGQADLLGHGVRHGCRFNCHMLAVGWENEKSCQPVCFCVPCPNKRPKTSFPPTLRSDPPSLSAMDAQQVRVAVQQGREQGFSFLDGPVIPGVASVGVAFAVGHSIAAISVAAISSRLDATRRTAVAAELHKQVRSLSGSLDPEAAKAFR